MSRFAPKILAACALAALFASPLSALAMTTATLDVPPARVVGYSDLDLSRDSGVATLYSRINSAAREVCEPLDAVLSRLLRERFDCRQEAIAKAVADVNSPALTSYYLAKTRSIANNQR